MLQIKISNLSFFIHVTIMSIVKKAFDLFEI